jgi:glycosyltransferase involved in cell wall biosynthesis
MSASPSISLIICLYQQRRWLDTVLASVAHQSVDVPFEVVLCDDGSADGTFERASALADRFGLDLRYLWQPDRGFRLSRSRNNGIRCARGEVLVFVDGDSWLTPSCLDEHWRAQCARRSLVCGLRQTMIAPDESVPWPAELSAELPAPLKGEGMGKPTPDTAAEHERQRRWLTSEEPWMACLAGHFSIPATHAFEFDEQFRSWGSEDRDFAFRLFRAGLPVVLLPAPGVVQLRLPGERERRYEHEQIAAFLANKEYLQSKYPAGELAAAMEVVRYFHLDPQTSRWVTGRFRNDTPAAGVIAEFRAWADRNAGRDRPPCR